MCQEEDRARNMEAPRAYFGSLKYAHIKFLWCWFEKRRDTPCVSCYIRDVNQRVTPYCREDNFHIEYLSHSFFHLAIFALTKIKSKGRDTSHKHRVELHHGGRM